MSGKLRLGVMSLALAVGLPLATVGCAEHHYYRAYDPYYNDYHRWDRHEDAYYRKWIVETHRRRVDYRRLNRAEQREYWAWRHNHGRDHRDYDRDRDYDRR
jgi:hypothetical protein